MPSIPVRPPSPPSLDVDGAPRVIFHTPMMPPEAIIRTVDLAQMVTDPLALAEDVMYMTPLKNMSLACMQRAFTTL